MTLEGKELKHFNERYWTNTYLVHIFGGQYQVYLLLLFGLLI